MERTEIATERVALALCSVDPVYHISVEQTSPAMEDTYVIIPRLEGSVKVFYRYRLILEPVDEQT